MILTKRTVFVIIEVSIVAVLAVIIALWINYDYTHYCSLSEINPIYGEINPDDIDVIYAYERINYADYQEYTITNNEILDELREIVKHLKLKQINPMPSSAKHHGIREYRNFITMIKFSCNGQFYQYNLENMYGPYYYTSNINTDKFRYDLYAEVERQKELLDQNKQ